MGKALRGPTEKDEAGLLGAQGEQDRRDSSRLAKRTLLVVKLSITVGLCAWIVGYVDWALFWAAVRDSKLWVLGLVFGMRAGGLTISALKWQRLLVVQELRFGLGQLVRWYLTALFLTNFLPTSIGGDAYRVYKTWDNERARACALLAILAERVTGLLALLLLGYVAAIVTYARGGDPVAAALIILVTIALVAGAFGTWVVLRLRLAERLAGMKKIPRILARIPVILIGLLEDLGRHPRESVAIGAISFVFHMNKILVVWLLLYALGATTNVLELAVAVVAVEVIGLLPITLGGLGLVEGSFIYVMGHFGVGTETGLATMLLMRALMVPLSLVGAYFYSVGDGAGVGRPSPHAA